MSDVQPTLECHFTATSRLFRWQWMKQNLLERLFHSMFVPFYIVPSISSSAISVQYDYSRGNRLFKLSRLLNVKHEISPWHKLQHKVEMTLYNRKWMIRLGQKFLKGVTTGPYERFFAEELLCKRILFRNEYSVRNFFFEKFTKNWENAFFSSMSHNFKKLVVSYILSPPCIVQEWKPNSNLVIWLSVWWQREGFRFTHLYR